MSNFKYLELSGIEFTEYVGYPLMEKNMPGSLKKKPGMGKDVPPGTAAKKIVAKKKKTTKKKY